MINAASIAKMRRCAHHQCAARELINEADLAAAIRAGTSPEQHWMCLRKSRRKTSSNRAFECDHHAHVRVPRPKHKKSWERRCGADQDYLAEGVIRNAVNLPALSPDQYRRVRPYLELAERLGSLVSQAQQRGGADSHPVCGRGGRG